MNECQTLRFCPQCGAADVTTREVSPNHIVELCCPHCGIIADLLWRDQILVGTCAPHDPDSDAEAW